ncbi:hypothetical protein T492DRAFT_917164 [Pavlovales sp. CCMP2436]|nr:hypothetical protein T492DRAFT_917164 [Pavlovales sp. CCMP2436]
MRDPAPSATPHRRARLLLGFSALVAAACLLSLVQQNRESAHFEAADAATKPISDAVTIPGGDCPLHDFIPAMPCVKDSGSQSCCSGLRQAFKNKCPCRGLPGILLSHGGTGLIIADNMIRCGYSEGVDAKYGEPVAAVDFVAESLGCFDRTEWCNDLLPGLDIRLSEVNKGLLQVADDANGWIYAAGTNGNTSVASTVCKALGYLRMVSTSVDVAVNSYRRISCSTTAAASGKISGCEVKDTAKTPGALRIECAREQVNPLSPNAIYQDRPELCMRTGQRSFRENRLACTSSKLGTAVAGHQRSIGAAHAICGTAGINETRIKWYDGFQDDFSAYVTISRLADGRFMTFQKVHGHINGTDLLTPEEFNIDKRKAHLDNSELHVLTTRVNYEGKGLGAEFRGEIYAMLQQCLPS